MTTATILPLPRACFFDANGNPLASGLVYTYIVNTTTPKTTWQDSGEATPNTNPIVLDANGSCLMYGNGSYSLVVTDALGNNVPAYSGITASFSPPSQFASIADLRLNATTGANFGSIYVEGYRTSADGGEGTFIFVSTDTTSTDNGGTIIVDAANNRWYRDTQGNPLSVKWFGAYGDNSHDDTSSIQNCLNAVTSGGAAYFPTGRYQVTTTLNVSPVVYLNGDGYNATRIVSANATGDVVSFSGGMSTTFGGGITNMCIDTSVVRTAGAALKCSNIQEFLIDKFSVNTTAGGSHFTGITLESTSGLQFQTRVTNFSIFGCTNIGVLLGDTGTGSNGAVGDLIMSNGLLSGCGKGIVANNLSGFYWDNVDVFGSITAGITFAPTNTSNQTCTFGLLVNILADSTSNGPGWLFNGNGIIADLSLSNCWGASNHSMGFDFTSGMNSVKLVNCIATNNQQNGFEVRATGNVIFVSCAAEANSVASSATYHGFNIEANVSGFQILDCISGGVGFEVASGGTNQQGYGIAVQAGTGDAFIITGNRLPLNITGGLTNGASGANVVVTNNISH